METQLAAAHLFTLVQKNNRLNEPVLTLLHRNGNHCTAGRTGKPKLKFCPIFQNNTH